MQKAKCLIILSFFLLSPVMLTADTALGEITGGILLYEVNPYGDEGVSVFNYGETGVNLRGWSVKDGEGTIQFKDDLYIGPNERLTAVSAVTAGDLFSGRDRTIAFSDPRVNKDGNFALANTGDDVSLYKGNDLMDAVCYGNKAAAAGWTGDPARIQSGKYLLRTGISDTNTVSDWISTKPGLTNNPFDPDLYFDAAVTPFSFPESEGTPIFRAIEGAEEEVLISIYMLTSVKLVALLCELSEKGVDVRVLLEGDILGNMGSSEIPLMRSLADAGGEVFFINDPVAGNFERYAYVHNKYAVIDQRVAVVTSENWTTDNLGTGGNRGWGAVIESEDYAGYVRDIFLNDVSMEWGDIMTLSDRYPDAKPYSGTLTYSPPSSYETVTYDAKVMPVFSPDNSHSALRYFIEHAETRVYSQQLDLGTSYQTIANDASPLKWLSSAAGRGVDSRFILDASIDRNEVNAIADMINNTTNVKALALDGREGVFSMIHNKGVVIDDLVWVASVNWTDNSFMNNREIAVMIDSPEVSDFFVEIFKEDWGTDFGSDLRITHETYLSDGERIHAFTVNGPENSKYTWDLGNGDIRESDINKIICTGLAEGTYTMTVTSVESGLSASITYTVSAEKEEPAGNGSTLIVAGGAGILAAIGAVLAFIKRSIGRRSG